MKIKSPKPKNVRGVRLSDTMWERIKSLAAVVEMCPSEYIRRIIEDHLSIISKKEN